MFKKTTCSIVLAYGLILIAVAIAAYLRKQSMVSLLVGGGLGALVVISSLLLFAKKRAGILSSVILTLITSAVFAVRYSLTEKAIPGIMAVLSGAMLLLLLGLSVKWKNSEKNQ